MTFSEFTPVQAVLGFGRFDPQIADIGAYLWNNGITPLLAFTGGLGTDSGVLHQLKVPEGAFLYLAAYLRGVPMEALVADIEATNGEQNCVLGYQAIAKRLGTAPTALGAIMHFTSVRRLTEQFYTVAVKRGWPSFTLWVLPTAYRFNPDNPVDRDAAAGEMLRLVNWSATGYLRPQKLSVDLVDIARRLDAEAVAAGRKEKKS
jgi:hypothetical protein